MKRIQVALATFAMLAGIALAGAGSASANNGGGQFCGTGPWGQIIVCWQPWWGWNNWGNNWNHHGNDWDNHHGNDWDNHHGNDWH